MKLNFDIIALALLLGLLFIIGTLKILFFPRGTIPSLAFSRIEELRINSWRIRWSAYPLKLHCVALFCFMVAFIDPHFMFKKAPSLPETSSSQQLPTKGIAIYLALDQSGSMGKIIEASSGLVNKKPMSKLDILKEVTKQFIIDHPSDLIGLVSFARVPRVLVPLTLDQQVLLNQLEKIQVVKHPEEDGTGIGYAIFKTTSLIAATRYFSEELRKEGPPPYTINSGVVIVVTDGFQDPSKLDLGNRLRTIELDDAAAYAKKEGIHLYIVNIDPAIASPEYAPHRKQLETITRETGGQFYMVNGNHNLQNIYENINRLEKGTISQEMNPKLTQDDSLNYSRFSLYPFFVGSGLLSLFIALFLESWVLKRTP